MKKLATEFYISSEKNKIEELNNLITQFNFLKESIHQKEYSFKNIKQESEERINKDISDYKNQTKEIKLARNTDDLLPLYKEEDYEIRYLWYDQKTKNSYLGIAYLEIDCGLKESILYIIENNIPFGTDIFEKFQLDYIKLKNLSTIIANYLAEVDAHFREDVIEIKIRYFDIKQKFTEAELNRYNEITNILSNIEVTEVDKKKLKQRDTNKYIFGLLIAKGELKNYWKYNTKNEVYGFKDGYNRNDVAKKFKRNNDGFTKVIYETTMGTTNNATANKNVFNDYKIMSLIIEDCKDQNIEIDEYFLKKYNEIKQKNI